MAGFRGLHSGVDVVRNAHLQMRVQFLVKFIIQFAASKRVTQPR
jgi:hypothetical protein